MSVIEREVQRCTDLIQNVGNDDLKYALEDRIDVLNYTKESIEGDIQNEFLTPP